MKRMLVVCLLILMSVMPALAFLGFGDIVFDPSNYEEAIDQLAQLQQQYSKLVQTYEMVRNQYDHMVLMAQQVPVDMMQRYRATATPWRTSNATNTYGTTGGWIASINTGANVAAGYQQATQRLAAYPSLDVIPTDQRDRVRTNYASVELADGANIHSLETIGRLRTNAPAVATAIQGLEADSLSSSPNMNTEIAVLNKINAANIIALRNTQDTNQLLVAMAEEQVVAAKRTRDAEAQTINNHVRFMSEGKTLMDSQATGASEAMLAWRMP